MSAIKRLATDVECQFFDSEPPPCEPDKDVTSSPFSDLFDFTQRARIVNMADVHPEELQWHWHPFLPVGKITLLTGDPGLGKTFITMDIAARTSRGEQCPNNSDYMPRGAVLLFVAEDDLADTVRPRLDAAGADVSMIYAIEGISKFDTTSKKRVDWSFSLDKDLAILEAELKRLADEQIAVSLVVIDPISAFLGKTDSHNNAEVRGLLKPLAELAGKYNVSIVAVSHLNKSGTGKSVYRSSGSLAFAAAARSVWVVSKDLDDPSRRLLLPVKCNLTKDPPGMAYSLIDGKVCWEADPVHITADEHMAKEANHDRNSDDSTELRRAVEWLRNELASGKVLSKTIESDAKHNDISAATLRRARGQLECKSKKEGNQWYLFLPN